MPLFEVDGWNLKEKRVVVEGKSNKKSKKQKNLKARGEENQIIGKSDEKDVKDQAKKEGSQESKSEQKKNKHGKDLIKQMANGKKRSMEEEQKAESVATSMQIKNLTPLQQKMMSKLSGSRFRWINEKLYTIGSGEALSLIKRNPALFEEYHQGFRSQVQLWPENPVEVFVQVISERAKSSPINAPGGLPGLPNKKVVIADMGCGEAQLAYDINEFVEEYNKKNKSKKHKSKRNRGPSMLDVEVHSFDLKRANDRITVADISNVPLKDESCSIVIFCLALMGTNFLDFIKEAHRILAPRGELWIAEIKSRFSESAEANGKGEKEVGTEFVDVLKTFGFFHKKTDNSNKMFSRFEFFKPPQEIIEEMSQRQQKRKKFIEQESKAESINSKREKDPEGNWLLKPCIYKRR